MDKADKNTIAQRLAGRSPAAAAFFRVECFDRLPSTNSYAIQRACGGEREGLAVIAAGQSAGRGRSERSFVSPDGRGLYLSVLLRPDCGIRYAAIAPHTAALAAAQAVEAVCGLTTRIRWVNDLLSGGRKLCGILAESGLSGDIVGHLVIGIGINLYGGDDGYADELRGIVTTVQTETGRAPDINELAAELLIRLFNKYTAFKIGYDHAAHAVLDEYEDRMGLAGKTVCIIDGDNKYTAVFEGINNDGNMIITADGQRRVLVSGNVSVREI